MPSLCLSLGFADDTTNEYYVIGISMVRELYKPPYSFDSILGREHLET